jgi:hypothetical protein
MTVPPEFVARVKQNERIFIADWIASENKLDQIRLRGGELSAQEMRTVQAFMTFVESAIRCGEYKQEAKTE